MDCTGVKVNCKRHGGEEIGNRYNFQILTSKFDYSGISCKQRQNLWCKKECQRCKEK